ncbi:hypothetical protein D3C75_1100000 [compost metagenome]
MHQWQQHFGTVIGARDALLADVGEVRQHGGAAYPLAPRYRVAAGIDALVAAVVLDWQLEEHAGLGNTIQKAGVAQGQGRQADAVGLGFQAH